MNELALKLMLSGDLAGALAALEDGDATARKALKEGRVNAALVRLRKVVGADPEIEPRAGLSDIPNAPADANQPRSE